MHRDSNSQLKCSISPSSDKGSDKYSRLINPESIFVYYLHGIYRIKHYSSGRSKVVDAGSENFFFLLEVRISQFTDYFAFKIFALRGVMCRLINFGFDLLGFH